MSRPVVVLGLDAATFEVIEPLLHTGHLPQMARLVREGTRGPLRSTYPPNSAPAWVSFLTGLDPSHHGVLGFRTLDLTKYSCYEEHLVNSSSVAGRTVFDLAGTQGKRVIGFGIPITYPVWPVNGVLCAGYPTPDERRAFTFPSSLGQAWGPLSPLRIDQVTVADVDTQVSTLRYQLDRSASLWETLLHGERFDLAVLVTQVPDSMQHKFFKFRTPGFPGVSPQQQARYRGLIDEFYVLFDQVVGRVRAAAGDEALVFVVSDHGAGPRPITACNLNAWLRAHEWLRVAEGPRAHLTGGIGRLGEWAKENLPIRNWVKKRLPPRLKETVSQALTQSSAIDWAHTRAYRVPMQHPIEGINLNVRGRQPRGCVSPGAEYEALRDEVAAALATLVDPHTGLRPVVRAWRREELFRGPLDRIPDLLVELDPRYDGGPGLRELIAPVPASMLRTVSGYHCMEGIFLAAGPGIRAGERLTGATITDMAPTMLYALGLPVPRTMDGRVLLDAFAADHVRAEPPQFSEDGAGTAAEILALSQEDEEAMTRALKGLGYLS